MLSVIPNPPRVALPIVGSEDLFPVRRVYCVGRNYAAHAREMGADLPVAELAADFETDLIARGHDADDMSALARVIRERSGLPS